MLHTINKSPFETSDLENCMRFLDKNDVVLLFEDGVYAAASSTARSALVEEIMKSNTVYALQADLKARGIDKLIVGVEMADYERFVDLVEAHPVKAWL